MIKNLGECSPGDKIRIHNLGSITSSIHRFTEMGFTINTVIDVILNDGRSPILIQSKGVRVILSREIANQIQVN